MKRVRLFVMAVLLMATLTAVADGKQVVTVNGTTIEKVVTRITFEGDQVVLTFSDNTTQVADMALVNIAFSSNSTGIDEMQTAKKPAQNVYDVNGRLLGSTAARLAKGVYVINGKKFIIK